MIVAERRTSADGGARALDRLQPSNWPLHGVHRRQHRGHARGIDRLQRSGDQAHVVIRRQPGDAARVRPDAEPAHRRFEVVDEVAMAHHDAFGVSGRTRCILQQREIRGIGRGAVPPSLRGPGIVADDESRHLIQPRVSELRGDAGLRARIGEDQRRVAVPAYGRERPRQTPRPRREARHRNQSGVEAGEQRNDVAEPGLEHDQDGLARSRPIQKRRGEGAGAVIERPVAHGLFERLAVAQEGVG